VAVTASRARERASTNVVGRTVEQSGAIAYRIAFQD